MRYPIPKVRPEKWRRRGFAPAVLTMMLLAAGICLSPGLARGGMIFQNVGPNPAGDDFHSASLNPFMPIPVSQLGQCAWINAGLTAFDRANPNWSYHWATQAQEAKAEAGITILDYFPYAATRPRVESAPGSNSTPGNPNGTHVFGATNEGQYGGAVINLQYTPQTGLNIGTQPGHHFHWIQAYTGTLWGHAVPALLDNDPAPGHAYRQQSTVTPFYDAVYAAGTLYNDANRGGWFVDIPYIPEFDSYWTHREYEQNPVASVQFQVVLADEQVLANGNHVLTLYGGEWWGFTYSAVDRPVPEPASCLLMALGGGGLFFFRRVTGRMCVA